MDHGRGGARRLKTALASSVCAVAIVLSLPVSAWARSVFTPYPANHASVMGSPVIVGAEVISAVALDSRDAAVKLDDGAFMKAVTVDRGSVTGGWNAGEQQLSDGTWVIHWTWVAATAVDPEKATLYILPTALPSGDHTMTVRINGESSVSTFHVAPAGPTVTGISPGRGATVATTTPTVSVTFAAPVGIGVVTINGAAAGISGNVGSLKLPVQADPSTVTVTVRVADSNGDAAVVNWSFRVDTGRAAVSLPYCVSSGCHALGYATKPGMTAECLKCHAGTTAPLHGVKGEKAHASIPLGASATCVECHGRDFSSIAGVPGEHQGCSCHALGQADSPKMCVDCHGNSAGGHLTLHETAIVSEPLAGAGGAVCGDCHAPNLVTEHARATASSSAAGCAACHPGLRSTIVTFDPSTCSQAGCHTPASSAPMHAGVSAAHVPPASASTCTGCHTGGLTVIHSDASTTTAGVTHRGCLVCHAPGATPKSGDCASCHAAASTGGHVAVHDTTTASTPLAGGGGAVCGDCHDANLMTEHAKPATSSSAAGCTACHPSPRSTIATFDPATCVQGGCHTAVSSAPMHGDMTVAHTPPASAASCVSCHGGGLTIIHSNATTTTAGVTRRACQVCHPGGTIPVSGDCTGCHGGHGDLTAAHTASASAAAFTILGTDAGTHACSECHAQSDVRSLHPSCSSCHPEPVQSMGPWDKSCTASACHSAGSPVPTHRTLDASHSVGPQPCTAAGCHPGAGNLASIHSAATTTTAGTTLSGCQVCHASGRTASATCSDCHSMAGHTDVSALHASAGGSAFIDTGVEDDADHYYGDAPFGVWDECGTCHVQDLSSLHTGGCWTCHGSADSAVRSGIAAGDTRCQTCHAAGSYHQDAWQPHQAVHDSGGCDCHEDVSGTWMGYTVDPENCGHCHTFPNVVDTAAPVTTSNAVATYVGPAVITLSVHDLPLGGSMVAHTYHRLDGGAPAEGMQVNVAPPASGSQAHSLEFWSVDNAGNVESHHIVPFTVARDTTAPTTTSDVRAAYWFSGLIGGGWRYVYGNPGGMMSWPGNITISGTDNGTLGVQTLNYVLDGQPTSINGPSAFLVPPVPAGVSATHTLSFWSTDFSGNIETAHATTFTCTIDTTAPVTTSNIVPGNTYVGTRTFTLTAADNTGGCGVRGTYWQLDSTTGSWQTGTSVTVTAPASGTVAHTLYWYSTDNVYNQETRRSVAFNVSH